MVRIHVRLTQMPKVAMDDVIAHEFPHLIQHNHSKNLLANPWQHIAHLD